MWGLIEASFLVGDSRYFLMTFSSAVERLKSMRKSVENLSPLEQKTVRAHRSRSTLASAVTTAKMFFCLLNFFFKIFNAKSKDTVHECEIEFGLSPVSDVNY